MNRLIAICLISLSCAAIAQAKITGDYLETRSADVYTGQCFANAETGLAGDQAILAWHVTAGTWNGVKLDGLNVVAAVRANATLGDPYGNPYPAKTVLIVDDQASAAERQALISFARHMGGKLVENVVRVEVAPVDMRVLHEASANTAHAGHAMASGRAVLRAGSFASVETRGLDEADHICGNEVTFYPPLTTTQHAMPAVALTDKYVGPGLGVAWTLHDKRSAFVGSFRE
jgi:hypothetical protein